MLASASATEVPHSPAASRCFGLHGEGAATATQSMVLPGQRAECHRADIATKQIAYATNMLE